MDGILFQYITAFVTLFTFTCFMAVTFRWCRLNSRLPPGPGSYSLFGNFNEIRILGFQEVIKKYQKIYGDIFTLRVFNSVLIVCNGYDLLKEMLVTNGRQFSDRIPNSVDKFVFKGKGIIFASGEIWKQHRRLALQTLRDFGMGKNKIEIKIQDEVGYLLDALDKTNGEPFDIGPLLHNAVANVIASVVFGERFEYDDKDFQEYIRQLNKTANYPIVFRKHWFRHIPGDPFGVRSLQNTLTYLRKFYEKRMNKHFEDFDDNNVRDFIDIYIKQMKNSNGTFEESRYNNEDLVSLIHELFGAGMETTASALRWGLIYLMRDDGIQSAVHEELNSCVSSDRLPSTSDRTRLPYVHATTLEILRFATIVPLTIRSVLQDTKFQGFTFPKSSKLLVNLASVLMDDKHWDEPHKFNPSRFLQGDSSVKEFEKVVSFGIGQRVCPGESFAKMELFLFLAAMSQRFRFLPPLGEDPPSLGGTYGITHSPKPYKLRAIRRTEPLL